MNNMPSDKTIFNNTEPCVPTNTEPGVPEEEPGVPTNTEPCVPEEEPCVSKEEPCVLKDEPGVPEEEPGTCIADRYFSKFCGKANWRYITYKYRNHSGHRMSDSIIPVYLCDFHYKWLKTQNSLEMRGEDADDAIEDDLLPQFANNIYRVWRCFNKSSSKNTLYLLEGTFKDTIDLKDDENIWQLQGIFSWNGGKIFEIVPITELSVINWLVTQQSMYHYPPMRRRIWLSKETGDQCDDEEVKYVNGGCYLKDVVNPIYYTTKISSDFQMGFCPDQINNFFWKKKKNFNFIKFEECLDFIHNHIDDSHIGNIINWYDLYENFGYSVEGLYQKVFLLKEALLFNNKETLKSLKPSEFSYMPMSTQHLHMHVIMWVLYVATNHEFYWDATFCKTPDFCEDEKAYKHFFQNLVDLFVAKGLVKQLLCLAISGERERTIFSKQRAAHNILHENFEVVKMIVPKHISANSDIITDDKTALQYWETYDNQYFNPAMFAQYGHFYNEMFDRNEDIGNYLKLH